MATPNIFQAALTPQPDNAGNRLLEDYLAQQKAKTWAQMLLHEGSDTKPVAGHVQGISKMLTAGLGGLYDRWDAEEAGKLRLAEENRDTANLSKLWKATQEPAPSTSSNVEGKQAALPEGITPDEDKAIRTILAEGGSDEVQAGAIAGVMRNRAQLAGSTPGAEATRGKDGIHQFSAWNNPQSKNYPGNYGPQNPAYAKAAAIALPVLRGEAPDPTEGATHYYNPTLQAQLAASGDPQHPAKPKWDNGSGRDIGPHRFFKLPYGEKRAEGGPPAPPQSAGPPIPGPGAAAAAMVGQQAPPPPVQVAALQQPPTSGRSASDALPPEALAAGLRGQPIPPRGGGPPPPPIPPQGPQVAQAGPMTPRPGGPIVIPPAPAPAAPPQAQGQPVPGQPVPGAVQPPGPPSAPSVPSAPPSAPGQPAPQGQVRMNPFGLQPRGKLTEDQFIAAARAMRKPNSPAAAMGKALIERHLQAGGQQFSLEGKTFNQDDKGNVSLVDKPDERIARYRETLREAEKLGLKPGTPEHNAFTMKQVERIMGEPGTQVNVNPGERKEDTVAGEARGKRLAALEGAAAGYGRTASQLNMLKEATKLAPTGAAQGYFANAGAWAKSFGVDLSVLGMDPNTPVQGQAMKAIVNQMISKKLENGEFPSTQLSDKDVTFLVEQFPNLANTPEANSLILEAMKRSNELSRDIGREYTRWRKNEGKGQNFADFESSDRFIEMTSQDLFADLAEKAKALPQDAPPPEAPGTGTPPARVRTYTPGKGWGP